MQNESKPFGVKATNSFKKNFNQSILKLSFLYGAILVTILCISGVITFNEFSGRIGKRFSTPPPTVTITLPNGTTISKGPVDNGLGRELNGPQVNRVQENRVQVRNDKNAQTLTAADIRADLIASLIFVNGILLLLASIASYWLARLTLRPIQVAYERQRRFLGDASHELRTPLSILQIELENELHTEKNAPVRNAETREAIESKLEEVQRMSKLVGDLLTLSRLDDDTAPKLRKTTRVAVGEFSSLINKITERLTSLAETHSVSLSFVDEITQTTSTSSNTFKNRHIIIDEELLSHALTNLIQNAIFYNKKDGTVEVKIKAHGKRIQIIVSDTGVGIHEHDLQHIFDRFYRADKSRTRSNVKHSGSGLGLSIAKTTLAHMNATLHLASEVDKGTIATIEFFTLTS